MKKEDAYVKRLQLNIGKTKQMYNRGMRATKIAARLGLPESTVRCYISMIEKSKLAKNVK